MSDPHRSRAWLDAQLGGEAELSGPPDGAQARVLAGVLAEVGAASTVSIARDSAKAGDGGGQTGVGTTSAGKVAIALEGGFLAKHALLACLITGGITASQPIGARHAAPAVAAQSTPAVLDRSEGDGAGVVTESDPRPVTSSASVETHAPPASGPGPLNSGEEQDPIAPAPRARLAVAKAAPGRTRPRRAPSRSDRAVESARAPAPESPKTPPEQPAPPSVAPPPVEPAAPSPPAPARPVDDAQLRAERRLLSAAHRAVKTGRAAEVASLIRTYRRRFPRGRLQEESWIIEIRALVALGDMPAAREAARRFVDRHPDSAHRSTVDALLH